MIATLGFESGSVTIRHSGSQSMRTTMRAHINRSNSRIPVCKGRVARLNAMMQRLIIAISATIPIQKFAGEGENVSCEILKFKTVIF